MRKLLFLLPLLLAACGNVTPTAPDAQSEGKTFQQALQEPGWTETAPQYWERATDSGTESIYVGPAGARAALKVREAELRQIAAQEPTNETLITQLRRDVADLTAYVTSAPAGGLVSQGSMADCSYAASVKPTSSMPGIKATAWIRCGMPRSPHAFAHVTINGGAVESWPTEDEFSASADASWARRDAVTCSGTAEASVYINGVMYGAYASGSRCR